LKNFQERVMADVLSPEEGRFARNYQGVAVLALSLGGGLIFAFAIVWIVLAVTGVLPNHNPITETISLPLIVIVGVSLLLIAIALVAFTYSVIGLSSAKDALGLPDGSVRAVIALMLLVLFSIMAIFLYNSVAHRGPQTMEHVSAETIADMKSRGVMVLNQEEELAGHKFKVTLYEINSPADDIAKQLIAMLGTLVTAVASFYFGSASVASASAAVTGRSIDGPQDITIRPQTLLSNDQEQNLVIGGTGLASVKTVHLEKAGEADIPATLVDSTDGKGHDSYG
jgi:hypothetical protein